MAHSAMVRDRSPQLKGLTMSERTPRKLTLNRDVLKRLSQTEAANVWGATTRPCTNSGCIDQCVETYVHNCMSAGCTVGGDSCDPCTNSCAGTCGSCGESCEASCGGTCDCPSEATCNINDSCDQCSDFTCGGDICTSGVANNTECCDTAWTCAPQCY